MDFTVTFFIRTLSLAERIITSCPSILYVTQHNFFYNYFIFINYFCKSISWQKFSATSLYQPLQYYSKDAETVMDPYKIYPYTAHNFYRSLEQSVNNTFYTVIYRNICVHSEYILFIHLVNTSNLIRYIIGVHFLYIPENALNGMEKFLRLHTNFCQVNTTICYCLSIYLIPANF